MKVLVCSPGLTFQLDAPYSTTYRANALASAGLIVTVVGFPSKLEYEAAPHQFDYVSVLDSQPPARREKWNRWKAKFGAYWTFIIEPWLVKHFCYQLARKQDYSIIYITHPEPWMMLPLVWWERLCGVRVPTVVTIAGVFIIKSTLAGRPLSSNLRSYLNHYASRWLPRFMGVTFNSKHVPPALGFRNMKGVSLIPEGQEQLASIRSQATARTTVGLPVTGRVLLLFGVASKAKGSDLLFNALQNVPPDFQMCIVGQTGGVYENSWGSAEQLNEKGWKDSLHIVDRYVSDEEMANYYAACDAIVIPYRFGFAATSTHLRRASDYGKAIIACDQYLIGDIVRNYDLGLLFKPENVEELRQYLLKFAGQPQEWFDQIRINSTRLVEEQSWENVGKMYRELFERMTAD